MVPDESLIQDNDTLHFYKQQFWSKYQLPAEKMALVGWLLSPIDVFQVVNWENESYTFMSGRASYILALTFAWRVNSIV